MNTLVLPQHDPAQERRAQAIADQRREWTPKSMSTLGGLPLMARVPLTEAPSPTWFIKLLALLPAIQLNRVLGSLDAKSRRRGAIVGRSWAMPSLPITMDAKEVGPFAEAFLRDVSRATVASFDDTSATAIQSPQSETSSLAQYQALFRTLPLPLIAREWPGGGDSLFARLRVAGSNPEVLTGVRSLEDAGIDVQWSRVVPSESLESASAEHRLFLADYRALAALKSRPAENGFLRYISSPIALFIQDHESNVLRPVGIQLKTGGAVFTPHDSAWRLARQAVQVADGNDHELRSHLARTHFLVELIAIATHRNLAPSHPIHALLTQHFTGTVFINHSARTDLIADGGAVDRIFAGTIESSRTVSTEALASYNFWNSRIPERFVRRGTDALVEYPFRDDAIDLWNAIREWMRAYVETFYADDAVLAADIEVSAWSEALSEPLGNGGVPGWKKPTTRTEFIDVLTLIVFTASGQHAALNFPQWTHMSFAPAMSGALWSPPPTAPGQRAEEHDWLSLLPPENVALAQAEVLYTLGSVRHAPLGEYELFGDPRIDTVLVPRFQESLAALERSIAERNQQRRIAYTQLVPSTIPRSINI
jgi:arachidonate 15-lipoxygenase